MIAPSGVTMRERRPWAIQRDQAMSYPTSGQSQYVPYYKRMQLEREAKVTPIINANLLLQPSRDASITDFPS